MNDNKDSQFNPKFLTVVLTIAFLLIVGIFVYRTTTEIKQDDYEDIISFYSLTNLKVQNTVMSSYKNDGKITYSEYSNIKNTEQEEATRGNLLETKSYLERTFIQK